MTDKPLSPRHLRFVHEYLKDGNATRAYIRAGYASRHAQSCASRLLAEPRIEAVLVAGRQRLAQALEVDAQRLGEEYAKIAFANISDFLEVEEDGRLRIDIAKASRAQSAGLLDVVVSQGRQSQTVRLKLGKLKALEMLTRHIGLFARKPEAGPTPEERDRLEAQNAALRQAEARRQDEQARLRRELDEARRALREAEAKIERARQEPPVDDETPVDDGAPAQVTARPPVMIGPARPPIARQPMRHVTPGPCPGAKRVWSGYPPDSHEALRRAMAAHGIGAIAPRRS